MLLQLEHKLILDISDIKTELSAVSNFDCRFTALISQQQSLNDQLEALIYDSEELEAALAVLIQDRT
jgi:hypothetical protein